MPVRQIRVMAWNIQNFGAAAETYPRYKGKNSKLLASFIKAVVRHYQVDVLLMMEVFRTAEPHLDQVMFALNRGLPNADADWCYDWIRGAVRDSAAVTPSNTINSSANLAWTSSSFASRAEGYAVFWRCNQTNRFTLRTAAQGMSEQVFHQDRFTGPLPLDHGLNLNLRGRELRTVKPTPYVQAEYGFVKRQPTLNWVDSTYPDVSTYANPYVPRWEEVRRPAYALLELNVAGGNDKKLLPLLVYHAPSRDQGARTGVYCSGLAQELYVHGGVALNRVIAAGDYNLNALKTDNWDQSYRPYWRGPVADPSVWDSGAECEGINDPRGSTGTILKLWDRKTNTPITGNNLANYTGKPIDNLFIRGLDNAGFAVPDLANKVMTGGVFTGALITAWLARLTKTETQALATGGRIDATEGPMLNVRIPKTNKRKLIQAYPSMTNWTAFKAAVTRGDFTGAPATGIGTEAREAAIFVHDFVSDHLPVYVSFDIAALT
jgi:hypothetical protein